MRNQTLTVESKGAPRFQLNWRDLGKIGKGAIIAVGGALCAYLLDQLNLLSETSYAWAIPVLSISINTLWKWLQDRT